MPGRGPRPRKKPGTLTPGFWLRIIREHRDRYRTELTDPAILDAIGDAAGLDILDAGCGEGYMARELASLGARHVNGSGLVITRLTEPHPSEQRLAAGQWWRENFPRPLFLLITALKPSLMALG